MGNYKKIIIWGVNIALFVAVVYMGITQAGLGAEITLLEDEIQAKMEQKNDLSEKLLLASSTSSLTEKSEDMGFLKPSEVIYIDSIDSYASLLP